jgi:hypothetical protein
MAAIDRHLYMLHANRLDRCSMIQIYSKFVIHLSRLSTTIDIDKKLYVISNEFQYMNSIMTFSSMYVCMFCELSIVMMIFYVRESMESTFDKFSCLKMYTLQTMPTCFIELQEKTRQW